jgi:NADH dehydrogenase
MRNAGEAPHVVIIGGGFGGLYAARELRRAPVRVTLIDRRNHHLFFPLLYQVATAGLNPADIATPIRRVLRRQGNACVLMAEATSIDTAARRVVLADGEIRYDWLIVAAGSERSYFGHDEWQGAAPSLLSLEDALEIRRRILSAYEMAEREPDAGRRDEWLTFVVVGGGPTGVELSGAIAEMARHALARDFRRIDPGHTRVILLEGADRLLLSFPAELSQKARVSLEKLGVDVRCGERATVVDADGVTLGAKRIAARNVFWAAGVKASGLASSLRAPMDRSGRVLVEADLSVQGHPEIFVVGDLAAARSGAGFVPGLAPAAIQEGRHAARNIVRALGGGSTLPFTYVNRGNLATIGRAAAVADFGRVRLSGFIAWQAWLLVHIFWLIGFRNRLLVLFEWAWAYLTYDRGSRLVTGTPSTHGRVVGPS